MRAIYAGASGCRTYSVLDPYAFVFFTWGVRRELPMSELKAYTALKDRMMSARRAAAGRGRGVKLEQWIFGSWSAQGSRTECPVRVESGRSPMAAIGHLPH